MISYFGQCWNYFSYRSFVVSHFNWYSQYNSSSKPKTTDTQNEFPQGIREQIKGTKPAKEMFLSTVDRTPECHLRMVGKRWETSESQIERWETSESQIGEEKAASHAPTLQKQECAPPWVGDDAIQTKKNVISYCSRLLGTKPKTQKIPLNQTWLWYHVTKSR